MMWLPKAEALAAAARAVRAPKDFAARGEVPPGHEQDCTMCTLARSSTVLAGNAHAVAMLDQFAARPGHLLVVLRRHAEHVATLPWPEYEAMSQLAWQLAGALDRVLAPKRIYIAALGSAEPRATSFPHVHLHVIPLPHGDERDRPASVLTWEHGMYVFEDDAEEQALCARLRAQL